MVPVPATCVPQPTHGGSVLMLVGGRRQVGAKPVHETGGGSASGSVGAGCATGSNSRQVTKQQLEPH
eukprot:5134525-Alexandrium_andersonii.AAC.1